MEKIKFTICKLCPSHERNVDAVPCRHRHEGNQAPNKRRKSFHLNRTTVPLSLGGYKMGIVETIIMDLGGWVTVALRPSAVARAPPVAAT